MALDLKVVITLKGDRGFIGVQAPDSDPVLTAFEGDLEAALLLVPVVVEQAQEKWAESKRYPKCETPPPPPPPPPRPQRAAPPSRTTTPAAQPSLF